MSQDTLFPMPEPRTVESQRGADKSPPRMLVANRKQVELRPTDLDSLLAPDAPARAVWAFVQSLDLTELYDLIKAREGHVGRPPIDPAILLSLWLYATIDGVGSARRLDELCVRDVAYQWLCGGVGVNYHTLSDFRTARLEFLDRLLTRSVATLMHEGLVQLRRVAQDGMRVRASAGAASFRRGPSLKRCLDAAQEQVAALRREMEEDAGAASQRERAARQRAAAEQQARIQEALRRFQEMERQAAASKKDKTRVSTTDPEARIMKMGDGGFRPAFNCQFATDTETQVIVGVDATNEGSDFGQMEPMLEQIDRRYGERPAEYLVDGGYAKKEAIDAVSSTTRVYAPPMKKKNTPDPYAVRPGDTPPVAEWRERMATEEAKVIYRERAATAECVNALARNRGLQQLRVRGQRKALAVFLWYALAHNMMRAAALRAETS